MLSTKNIILNYTDIPVTWIFEHYCNLHERLVGQDVKIKSLFNKTDKIPSMCIYFTKDIYKFKDFSTGANGSGVDLVKQLFNITFAEACSKLTTDYNNYIKNHKSYSKIESKEHEKYKVTNYITRSWSNYDKSFWIKYNIGSTLLHKHNVFPLEKYTLAKNENEIIIISGNHIYGYFKKDGSLYKIYQPKSNKKFIKVKGYIQGSEQSEDNTNLLITSSLKDIMAIKSLNLNLDIIAPDSENTMINQNEMQSYIRKYANVSVLFDNDQPGLEAMLKYKEKYGINVFVLPLSKDPSDSIKDYGVNKVLYTLVPLLQRSFEKNDISLWNE